MANRNESLHDRLDYPYNPHHTGIGLQRLKPGLKYRASAPGLDILAERMSINEPFAVRFRGISGKYMGLGERYLVARKTVYSIEDCIMSAIQHPSILFRVRVDSMNGHSRRPHLVKRVCRP